MVVKEIDKRLGYSDYPRERCFYHGVEALNTYELLAIILRTGTKSSSVMELARNTVEFFGGLRGFSKLSIQELEKIHGIGASKAITILAAIEFGKRIYQTDRVQAIKISDPLTCAEQFYDICKFMEQEQFWVVGLDVRNNLLAKKSLYTGGLNTVSIHSRDIFRYAISIGAASIICIHNHPSGDPKPSEDDVIVTRKLIEASHIIGIPILDHIIIGHDSYISLKESGYV